MVSDGTSVLNKNNGKPDICRCISLTSFEVLPDSDSDCALVRLTYIHVGIEAILKIGTI